VRGVGESGLVKEELNWATFEPMMVEVYRNTFSQHEVDGMLTFYRSEAGQAVIAKLPTVHAADHDEHAKPC